MRLGLHIGHLGELSGHDHWVAGAAIGAVAVAGLLGWLTKGGRDEDGEDADGAPDGDGAEAEAPA